MKLKSLIDPRLMIGALLFSSAVGLNAASDTWDGNTSAAWATSSNWDGAGVVPGTGDTATFNDLAGSGGAVIDLGAGVTINIIDFAAGADAYTLGSGGVGNDTLTFDDDGAINLAAGVTNDQTINAAVVLGDGTGNNTTIITNDSANKLTIAGDISTNGGSDNNGVRFLGTGETVVNNVSEDISGLFSFDVRGNVTLNGAVTSDGGDLRTVVRNGGSLDVTSTGSIGVGGLLVYDGVVTLNNTTANEAFADGVQFGHGSAGNGDSTINIVSGAGLDITSGGINYVADNSTANLSLITGAGKVNMTANRTITVADNALVAGAELTIASDFTSDNTNDDLTKDGDGTLLLTGTNNTSDNGINRVNIDAGVLQIEQDANLGDLNVSISNGSTAAVLEYVGSAGTTIDNQMRHTGNVGTNATIRANGTGVFELNNFSAAGTGTVLTLDGSNTSLNLISDDLGEWADTSLTKAGTGTWVISATQTYVGTTTVSAGTLLINGDSVAATGDVTVESGATLGGTGTIGGDTTIEAGAFLNPGNSPGLMTFDGDLTLAGTTTVEVAGAVRGTSFDAIDVDGLLTYGGALVITADTIIANGIYNLFGINGVEGGDFASIILSGAAYSNDALTFDTSDVWEATVSGKTYTFTQSTGNLGVIPEPGTMAMLLGGISLLALRRRRA